MTNEIKVLTVEVGLPHPSLSPNARSHWATISRHKKLLRERVANTIRFVYPSLVDANWPAARVQYAFYHRVDRVRDDDNFRGMMKAARDALGPQTIKRGGKVVAGCGLVEDDTFVYDDMPVIFAKSSDERVEITIHKLEQTR